MRCGHQVCNALFRLSRRCVHTKIKVTVERKCRHTKVITGFCLVAERNRIKINLGVLACPQTQNSHLAAAQEFYVVGLDARHAGLVVKKNPPRVLANRIKGVLNNGVRSAKPRISKADIVKVVVTARLGPQCNPSARTRASLEHHFLFTVQLLKLKYLLGVGVEQQLAVGLDAHFCKARALIQVAVDGQSTTSGNRQNTGPINFQSNRFGTIANLRRTNNPNVVVAKAHNPVTQHRDANGRPDLRVVPFPR